MGGNKVYPDQNKSTDNLLAGLDTDRNMQNNTEENKNTKQNASNSLTSKHSDWRESNSEEEENKEISSYPNFLIAFNINVGESISDNPSQTDGSNDSEQEITDEDLKQDLSETPNYYAPVIEEEAIREELKAKDEYEEKMESQEELEDKMQEEELKLLQQNYLNYYDKISITLTCYGDVSNLLLNILLITFLLSLNR